MVIGQENNVKEYTALAKEVASPQSLSLNQNDISAILEEESATKEENLVTEKKDMQREDFTLSSIPNITKEKVEKEPSQRKPVVEKTTKKVQESKNAPVVKGEKKYAIQLASFKEENKALKLREQLLGKGFGGYVVRIGNFYRLG